MLLGIAFQFVGIIDHLLLSLLVPIGEKQTRGLGLHQPVLPVLSLDSSGSSTYISNNSPQSKVGIKASSLPLSHPLTLETNMSHPESGDNPYQKVDYQFSRHEFGSKGVVRHSFQAVWFRKWLWLHYVCLRDLAFCYTLNSCCKI